MFRRIIWNDFIKSRAVSVIMLLFITAAATLIALAITLGLQLSDSIDALMTQAKTPHFLQMHSGTVDTERLGKFATQSKAVDQYQILEFLNIDGAEFIISKGTLADSVQDNGLSTQSNSFDYLLDLDGNIIQPIDGEIYVPIVYGKEGITNLGEKITIYGKLFTVAGFLRDSQMNSPLASSKRFLVSENDYASIRNKGNIEYLIEFRLNNLSDLSEFETLYSNTGLESNGPTVTYPLFRMMNAVSDGLMIAVLLLISIVAIFIACLCIRFTLLTQIEDDTREIGIMKAIGLSISDMKKLYIGKYLAIATAGSAVGRGLSIAIEKHALENIRLSFGSSVVAAYARMWAGVAVIIVLIAVLSYVNGILNKFKKISAAQAIRFGSISEKTANVKRMQLSKNNLIDTNMFLGFKDVLSRKKLYATMLFVVMASTFIMLVPQNLYNTISDSSFSTYMGIGKSDILIRVQQSNQMSKNIETVIETLESDNNVSEYVVYATKRFDIQGESGMSETIKVDLGNHTVFPVYYVKGNAPSEGNEIALSAINADELGKKIGDSIVITSDGAEKVLTVCGVYSDITNGGKTAKADFASTDGDVMWYTSYVKMKGNGLVSDSAENYTKQLPFAKIADIDSYIVQTFGSTIYSIKNVSMSAMVAALLMTILIALLMIKMLIIKERHQIAIMKSLGFTSRDITVQFLSRFLLVLLVGIVIGTIFANTFGETLAGAVIASFGATSFKFVINPIAAYLLCPLAMVCAVLFAVMIGTSGVPNIQVSMHIKE